MARSECPKCGSPLVKGIKGGDWICKSCGYRWSRYGETEKDSTLSKIRDSFNKWKPELKEAWSEKIHWKGIVAYILNLWKVVFILPALAFVYWLLFLYEIPYWIPYIGEETIIGYLAEINLGGIYVNGFASIGGAILMILIFHMFYSSKYKEPFSVKGYVVSLILQCIGIGIILVFLVYLLPNAPSYYNLLIEQGGYFGCVIGNMMSGRTGESCKLSGEVEVEKVNKIGGYGSLDLKLGIKDLNYKVSNPRSGEKYRLYFTVFNEMNKKLEGVLIKVKAGDTEATVNKCDYRDEPCELEEGETVFSAEFEEIPESMVNFVPVITIKYKQSVEGRNKFKIIWSTSAHVDEYKPVCAEGSSKQYYCPSTTQGPVDVIPSFIEKQIVSGEGQSIDLIIRIHNKGDGYAYPSNAEIEQVADAGYEVNIDCPSDMSSKFTITPEGSTVKSTGSIYEEYRDFYCDITVPYEIDETEFAKEITVKATFDYNYIYEFTESPMSVLTI